MVTILNVYQGLMECQSCSVEGSSVVALPGDKFIVSSFWYGLTDVVQLPAPSDLNQEPVLLDRYLLGANAIDISVGGDAIGGGDGDSEVNLFTIPCYYHRINLKDRIITDIRTDESALANVKVTCCRNITKFEDGWMVLSHTGESWLTDEKGNAKLSLRQFMGLKDNDRCVATCTLGASGPSGIVILRNDGDLMYKSPAGVKYYKLHIAGLESYLYVPMIIHNGNIIVLENNTLYVVPITALASETRSDQCYKLSCKCRCSMNRLGSHPAWGLVVTGDRCILRLDDKFNISQSTMPKSLQWESLGGGDIAFTENYILIPTITGGLAWGVMDWGVMDPP